MKSKKIIVSLLLVMFAITMVAGCGGTKAPVDKNQHPLRLD